MDFSLGMEAFGLEIDPAIASLLFILSAPKKAADSHEGLYG